MHVKNHIEQAVEYEMKIADKEIFPQTKEQGYWISMTFEWKESASIKPEIPKVMIMLPLTLFDAAIITANNGRIIATVCHKVENSGANQSLAR
jgi:hypothetical protein